MNYGRQIHSKTMEVQHTRTHSHSLKLNKGERRKLGEEKRSLRKNLRCWRLIL